MSDGHSGLSNEKVNEGGSGNFRLILSALTSTSGGEFVIHTTSTTFYLSGLQPLQFLTEIGLTPFPGKCPFHGDHCYYAVLAKTPHQVDHIGNFREVQMRHEAFKQFAASIGRLFELRQEETRILGGIGLNPPAIRPLGPPGTITVSEKEMPLWLESVKFPQLRELETAERAIRDQVDNFIGFLPLVYATGQTLEEAVLKSLRFLGLQAELAPKGFTVDILAETTDGSCNFGFEVTGISGPVKKDSPKLTQVMEFERTKEHGEKTVLLANTFNTVPVLERAGREHFTPQVLDFLGRFPILVMTGWDLYRMVGDVHGGQRSREELVELLYTTSGRLDYAQQGSD